MSKIFRFHNGNDTLEDWQASQVYGKTEIEGIDDPTGATASKQITSIPSPFARIDLVQSAFFYLAQKNHPLEGNTIHHKIVSDALDIGEMFFKIDQLKDKINIITWDKQKDLNALINSSSPKQKLYGETLKLYLEQDAGAYNFDMLKRIYLLQYNHKIIGGTSPATLFFTTANSITVDVAFGNETMLDSNYQPLHKRDPEYQKYLHHLIKAYPELGRKMKNIQDYLNRSLAELGNTNQALYNIINTLEAEEFQMAYDELDTGTPGDVIEIMGFPLRKRRKADVNIDVKASDFIIQSTKYSNEEKPLVLQNNFNKPELQYTIDKWHKDIKVPYLDTQTDLSRRNLPGLSQNYPYLTVSDFLEPYLIRTVYPINKDKYFNGNIKYEAGRDDQGYILPLTRLFFEFFDVKDLWEKIMYDSKPMFEMRQGAANAVTVTLRIPIIKAREYITFERIYYPGSELEVPQAEPENNKGIVIENQFSITTFPFLRFSSSETKQFYRIQLVNRDVSDIYKSTDYKLSFYGNNAKEAIQNSIVKNRSNKEVDGVKSDYYALQQDFDFIEIRHQLAKGIIIPKWPAFTQGTEEFTFSIDFGTTNTHIEYKIGQTGTPQPLDISEKDMQIATLFDDAKTDASFGGKGAMIIRDLIPHEFIPARIGNNYDYRFPVRTIISESKQLNTDEQTLSLADFNIPFIYEKDPEKGRITTNLKWAKKEKGNEKRVSAFFENLIMLMRTKVLLNYGNLKQVKLIWFYPSSMKAGRINDMREEWKDLFSKYFNDSNIPMDLTEAVAPFYYYKQTNIAVTAAARPVVSIDIGGGTSDVVIFKNNKPVVLTSFKFAANTLFGDAFSDFGTASTHGLINKYYAYFSNILDQNKLTNLKKVLETLKGKNRSDDINTFFFSLESNKNIIDPKLFSYSNLLSKDEDLKIVFVYFFAAILYHVGKGMRVMGLELPGSLLFSGTGSKITRIITADNITLSEFSRLLLEEAYGQEYGKDGLTVLAEKNIPKEVTCKGALMATPDDFAIDTSKLKKVYTGIDKPEYATLRYKQVEEDPNVKSLLLKEVEVFNQAFKKIDKLFNFCNRFNITADAMQKFYAKYEQNLNDYLMKGLAYNRALDDAMADDMAIEETLFFYPLIGVINTMMSELASL